MHWLRFTLAIALFTLPVVHCHAQTKKQRLPVPTDKTIAEAKKIIADAFKKEFAAAKTNPQKRELALKIIHEGEKSKEDVASEYACYDTARAIALSMGDVEVGLLAIAKSAERFNVEPLSASVDFVRQATPNAKSNEDLYFLLQSLDELASSLTKAKHWKGAAEICQIAAATAEKSRDADLTKVWNDRLAVVTAQQKESTNLATALATLDKSPLDTDANEAAGKLYCFTFDDWKRGLPMLALSKSKTLQAISEQELKASSASERLALADQWYTLAQLETGVVQQCIQRHALEHYRVAAENLEGLAKTRAQKRVAELFANAMPDRLPLSLLKPVEYRVHAPERGPFLLAEIAGRKFPNSLWAHAPNASGASVVVFELPCEFKYIQGMCAFHHDGAQPRTGVQFRANGNGPSIWNLKGRVEKTKTLAPFRIELKGVRKLDLIVDCPGDHHESNSVWVSPVLQK